MVQKWLLIYTLLELIHLAIKPALKYLFEIASVRFYILKRKQILCSTKIHLKETTEK